jgi:hypothetical protein
MRRNTQAPDPVAPTHRYGLFDWPTDVAFAVVCPGATAVFPFRVGRAVVVADVDVVTVVVVFARPGATAFFLLLAGRVVVVLVLPGAMALLPREVRVAGVVFVCPGAVVLRPRAFVPAGVVLVLPGAVALFPCNAPAARFACAAAFAVLALNTAAVKAGRRSDAAGRRGSGSFVSAGGP